MNDRFLETAVAAARAAGGYVLGRLGTVPPERVEAKDAADFVTEVDRASEALIVSALRDRFPEHGFLAEEAHRNDPGRSYRWIIDPLDGTTNYIHQFPVFSVSIALEHEGEIIVGVVFDPVRDELFAAEKGGGSTLNGKPLSVSTVQAGGRGLVATGFPFRNKEHLDRYLGAFREIFLSVGDLRRAGSAAIDLAYVAAGRVDGFFELGLAPWDMAAGSLLIREAGGSVTDFGGGDDFLGSGNIVAGGRQMHAVLLAATQNAFKGVLDS